MSSKDEFWTLLTFKYIDFFKINFSIIFMKKCFLSFFALFVCFAFLNFPSESSAAAPKGSMIDLYEAKEIAKKENKFVLLILTQQNTCGMCINFEKNILGSSTFKAFAKNHLIIVFIERDKDGKFVINEKVDKQKAARREFFKKYPNYKYIPGVFVIDPESDKDIFLESPGILKMSSSDFVKTIRKFKKGAQKAKQKS